MSEVVMTPMWYNDHAHIDNDDQMDRSTTGVEVQVHVPQQERCIY